MIPLRRFQALANAAVCLSLVSTGLHARAQELGLSTPDKSATIRFEAIAQFVEGHVVKSEAAGAQTDVVYQTVIYDGDRLESTRGAVLKFATRSGCIVTMRGEGAAAAPTEKKPWRFRAESLRLICNAQHTQETFGIANVPVNLKDGELLFLSNPSRVMLLRGSAQVHGQSLELRKLYSVTSVVTEVSPQPSAEVLRELNLKEKPPRESAAWPELPKQKTFKILFGDAFGGDRVIYDVSELSEKGLSGDGPRLQLQFRTPADHSIIVAASFRGTQNKERQGSYNSPPPEGSSSELDSLLIEGGYRFEFDRWWSPYFRFGAGRERARINFSSPSTGQYSNYAYLFYVVSAAAGVDAQMLPRILSPFGIYAAIEAQAIQSLWRDPARDNSNNGGFSSGGPQPFRLTSFNITLNLGLELQF